MDWRLALQAAAIFVAAAHFGHSVASTSEQTRSPSRLAKLSSIMRESVTLRQATVHDIPEILRQRRRMYEDMNYKDPAALDAMSSLSAAYLQKAITDGTFRGWLAFMGEQCVGGGAIIISPWLAHPYDLECRRATILNVYTDFQYRRRGIGRRLMQTMIEWCRREGLARITLHASDDGRRLYESLGFEDSNEMRLKLR